MKVFRRIVRVGMSAALLWGTGCGKEPLIGHWAEAPIVIDGDGSEWPISHMTYMEETRGVIGVANDDSTLYLLFRFRDEKTARKAMVGGVTAWWSPRGTKDREVGLRFAPVVSLRDIMHAQRPSPAETEGELEPEHVRPDSGLRGGPRSGVRGDREWMGFGRGFGRPTVPAPEEGVLHREVLLVTSEDPVGTPEWGDRRLRVQTGYRKGTYTYELALPLGAGESGIGIAAEGGVKVHFAVRVGGIPEEDRDLVTQNAPRPPGPDEGEGAGGGPSGGEGGPRGSGSGVIGGGGGRGPVGRGPGGRMNPFAEFAEIIDVSFDVLLASRPR